MINSCRKAFAEDIEVGDELDLDGDEYGDNELAIYGYAEVIRKTEWWDGNSGEPAITLWTTQGEFDMPSSHTVRVKIDD